MIRKIGAFRALNAIFLVLLAQGAFSQAPYIEGELLIIPSVEAAGEIYRVELSIDASTNPVSLN